MPSAAWVRMVTERGLRCDGLNRTHVRNWVWHLWPCWHTLRLNAVAVGVVLGLLSPVPPFHPRGLGMYSFPLSLIAMYGSVSPEVLGARAC
ncbi:hypothetical protein NDU88_000799 [Pleurodeles waltl]|uniref:Uncharacterized protein n=1 Tax=Pleurodeles waltl TaxID=8319 RepID=A0AAV7LB62_PLEWA|nr:hypothetical protein NDU88_000799 [Pleurodeles waltl]